MNRLMILLICFHYCSCNYTASNIPIAPVITEVPEEEMIFASDDAIYLDYEEEIEPPRSGEPSPPPYGLEMSDKIIKTGNMSIEVHSLTNAKIKIDSLVHSVNGYYENEMYQSYETKIKCSLVIRLPNTKFDSTLNVVEGAIGKLKTKNISAQNVTEEYVDLKIRLENKLAYLNQYQSILHKANTIKEILEVQDKIRQIEEEIESKKGRIKYLDDKVSYSTLDLTLTEETIQKIASGPTFTSRFSKAFKHGIQGFLDMILVIVSFWPLLVIALLIFIGRKKILNKFRSEKIIEHQEDSL